MLSAGVVAVFLSPCFASGNSTIETHKFTWEIGPQPPDFTQQMPKLPVRSIDFDTTEGTFMNVDVSPDGRTIVFDLLGDIYQLPIDGGDAVALTSGTAWDQAPRFSPDGAYVYFVSDRVGYKNLWQLTLADQSLTQITSLDRDVVGTPNWSPANNQLLVGIDAANELAGHRDMILHYVDPVSGAITPINPPSGPQRNSATRERLRDPVKTYSGVESFDEEVFFSESWYSGDWSRGYAQLYSFNRSTRTRSALTSEVTEYNEYKPQLSRSGEFLAYFRQYTRDTRTELRIVNRSTKRDYALVDFDVADDATKPSEDSRPNYAFTPDGESIVFWHDGKIHRVELVDGTLEIIPFRVVVKRQVVIRAKPKAQTVDDIEKSAIIRWPSLSADGQTMVFAAIGFVWVIDIETGKIRRLTNSNELEYMPAISPDGLRVAYISVSHADGEYGFGRLMVADIHGRESRELLADPDSDYLLPEWSDDGSKIALIRQQNWSVAGREVYGFGWTSAAKGYFNEVKIRPAPPGDYSRYFIFAFSIRFNEAGDKLLFSYPESIVRTVLEEADLNGLGSRTLAFGSSEVGGIAPAPDLQHLALTRRDGSVWIAPFHSGIDGPGSVSSLAPEAFRASANAGYYANWSSGSQLTFGFGTNVYKYRLEDASLYSLDIDVPITMNKPSQYLAFTGARLVTIAGDTGAGPIIPSGTLVARDNRIVALGPTDAVEIPPGATVIDVTGKTIVPGFLDTHYHRIGGSASAFGLPKSGISDMFSDKSAIAFGITSAWEPGGVADDGAPAAADLQLAGRTVGPRWSHTAAGRVGFPYEFLTSYAAALASVQQRRDLGVTLLKEYDAHTRQQRQWLLAAARANGLGAISHLETFDGMMTRVLDGYTGGDHPYLPTPFYRDVHELLSRTGYIWTPNIAITVGSIGQISDRKVFYCNAVFQEENQYYREKLKTYSVCDHDQSTPTVAYEAHRIGRVAEQVALARNAGVHIGVSAHNMPGSNLHREMWYMQKGGMTTEEVLRSTALVNAQKLGLHKRIGSLEVGKIADFLVLDEDPLDNILNTLSVKYTVQGGVVYDSKTGNRFEVSEMALTHGRESMALH
ncbi:MAG: amidohydrolase family protein [Pseudomonadota bacterium]